MGYKSMQFCKHSGCKELTTSTYCATHQPIYDAKRKEQFKRYDKRRGTATERGYTSRWSKYSKWYLAQPGNQICKLHLAGCTIVAQCVDHIKPHQGESDPLLWDTMNHQAACIHCNSVKGNKTIVGEYDMIAEISKQADGKRQG